MLQIREARNEVGRRIARELLQEHAASLGVNLCFEDFESEAALSLRACAPPGGCILLAESNRATHGCVGLCPLSEDICEMKWLFARSGACGGGLARTLALAAIRKARELGYSRMRLSASASAPEEMSLHENLGFREIAPSQGNPTRGTRFLELDLGAPRAA